MIIKCVIKVLVGMLACGTWAWDPEEDWVKLTSPPPREVHTSPGAHVELECEAAGSSPRIHWLPGRAPTLPAGPPAAPGGLVKARSRLVVRAGDKPMEVVCVATSGRKVVAARTAILPTEEVNLELEKPSVEKHPLVVLWHPVVLAPQHQAVTLPCRASPRGARTRWLDPHGTPLPALPDGSLRIPELAWRHMGPYTCVATNAKAHDSVTTFLYPLAVED